MKSLLILVALIITVPMAIEAKEIGTNGFYISKDMTTYTAADVPVLLNQMTIESPDKNILFYIHGRSQTLEKEWNNINAIEMTYNVRVLMLHWESWNYALGRPVANAYEASEQLGLGLHQISLYKQANYNYFQDHKMFIMFHSMGNIVLKNYVKKDNSIQDSTLFDTAILTGADVPFTGHRKWLSKLNLSRDVFVVMNQKDLVLLASTAHDYVDLNLASKNDDRLGLGKGLDNMLFLNSKTAPNAFYFDLTRLSGGDHRHYLSNKQEVEDLFHFMFKERFDQIPLNYKVKNNYFKF